MNKKIFLNFSVKEVLYAVLPSALILMALLVYARNYIDPAPPKRLVIATGRDEGDYQYFAKQYAEALNEEGIELVIRPTEGATENLRLLEDESADIDIGFVQDGIGNDTDLPNIVSLGSLYYEPLWIFYRGSQNLSNLSDLKGLKISAGHPGKETNILARKILSFAKLDSTTNKLLELSTDESISALKAGSVDLIFLNLPAEDPRIADLLSQNTIHLMSLNQAEAISRKNSSFHHLVLPRGVIDLEKNIPRQDVDLVGTTTSLLAQEDLHPALAYLLLKTAKQIHGGQGIFHRKGEFPENKDDHFPISPDAQNFYTHGAPFWQKYLPFWVAAWLDRFLFVVIPLMALIYPLAKLIPQIYHWRLKSQIYRLYGELRFLETQSQSQVSPRQSKKYIGELDRIEDKVNRMNLPLEYVEHTYSLRGHIHFVRERLAQSEI